METIPVVPAPEISSPLRADHVTESGNEDIITRDFAYPSANPLHRAVELTEAERKAAHRSHRSSRMALSSIPAVDMEGKAPPPQATKARSKDEQGDKTSFYRAFLSHEALLNLSNQVYFLGS